MHVLKSLDNFLLMIYTGGEYMIEGAKSMKTNRLKKLESKLPTVIVRLHRIQGQVAGIERMLQGKRDCVSIIQQIIAAREALDKVAILILEREARGCFGKKDSKKALQDLQHIITASFKAL